MRIFWLSLLVLILFLGCEKDSINKTNPAYLIPENTSIILKVADVESLKTQLSNNQILQDFSERTVFKNFKQDLSILDRLKNIEDLVITLGQNNVDSSIISFILPYNDSIFRVDSLSNWSQEPLKANNQNLLKTSFEDQLFYSKKIDAYLFISKNLNAVETAGKSKLQSKEFLDLLGKTDKESPISVIYKNSELSLETVITDSIQYELPFSSFSSLELDISQNDFKFKGITKSPDSIKNWIKAFNHTIAQELHLPSLAPADVVSFKSISFDSFEMFYNNLSELKGLQNSDRLKLLQNSVEAAIFKNPNNTTVVLLNILDAQGTLDNLEGLVPLDDYRSVPLYEFETDSLTNTALVPFMNLEGTRYIANIEDYVILAKDLESIESIISNFQNGNVLSEHPAFKDLMQSMTDESSIFIFETQERLSALINKNLEGNSNLASLKDSSFGLQYVIDDGFAHVNGIIKSSSSKGGIQGVSEEFSLNLDKELLTEPQFIKSSQTRQMDVLVQDITNVLYLISNDGQVLWKKPLDGKILGKVSQMDAKRNGSNLLVFATKNKVYVLDSKGNDVGKFPLSFKDDITQPLSVFDYDNNRKYRLLVTQGSQLLMYDKEGAPVNGFKFRSSSSPISSQPQHFRVSGKDYIVFSQGNTLEVLSRTGKTRIDVKESLSFSDNGIHLYNNKFTTTSNNGELLEVEMNGRVNKENLKLEENHRMDATSKTLATLSNNILSIRKSEVELPFGNYTSPQIFYINDKIYVSVTDLQAKKVYLFDSLAKLIPHFPVYGNSSVELENIDKDAALEMVTKGNDNAIIVYEIN